MAFNFNKILYNYRVNFTAISKLFNKYYKLVKKQDYYNINKTFLVDISRLKPHEATIPERVLEILLKILKDGKWIKPILVHDKTLTIMDGHHRYQAALLLGLKVIPCYLLNYNEDVTVCSRRANYLVTPDTIIQRSIEKKVYPYKTTCHKFYHNYKLSKFDLPIEGLL